MFRYQYFWSVDKVLRIDMQKKCHEDFMLVKSIEVPVLDLYILYVFNALCADSSLASNTCVKDYS